MKRENIIHTTLFTLLGIAIIGLAIADLLIGTTAIPVKEVLATLMGNATDASHATIILKMRLPKVIVATVAGMALSASGLQMQTLFRNPLAGPYVLGINSGASLGVALFTLATPLLGIATTSWLRMFGLTGMAWIGSAAILLLVMSLSRKIRNINVILIIGMMLSSAISAVVGILQYIGTEESLKAFVVWTMGSVATVTAEQLNILVPAVTVGIMVVFVGR